MQLLIPGKSRMRRQSGFSYVEMTLTVLIASLLVAGMMGVVDTASETGVDVRQHNQLTRDARYAMQTMVHAVSNTGKLLLPAAENPATAWPESVREFPPRVAFPAETAVLAMLVDSAQDLDDDGFADADNDRDGKLDEDPGGDSSFDYAPGLYAIDDDNDGQVDEQHTLSAGPLNEDDDEDDYANEDLIDGIDNDGDGKLDEDVKKQIDGDDLSGIGGVDDDGDGNIDEDDKNDDDEDGSIDEDWYDYLVFYLASGVLQRRLPVPWDTDGDSDVDGLDFVISDIAENVTRFRVELLPLSASGVQLVDITLELTHPDSGESLSLQTRVRVGGGI